MEVYLVRHGQTGGNVAHRHQHEKTPLTPEGAEQAALAAEHIAKLEPTHLITSSLVRAVETARIIGETCDLVPDTSHHFVELARPDRLYGHFHKSRASLAFYIRWYLGQTKPEEGGETYRAVRERIDGAKDILALYPEDARIVVVTHSVFMSLFLEHLCDSRPINPLRAALAFRRILTMRNTHIEPLRFDHSCADGHCGWSLHK